MLRILLILLLTLAASAQPGIPMHYLPGSQDGLLHGHLFSIPVRIGERTSQFILDTGIGVDLISTKLAQELGVSTPQVRYRGQRMSGQWLEVPLSWVPRLEVGGVEHQMVRVGVWDFDGFLPDTPEFAQVEGFLSLRFFQHQPFTIDYAHRQIVVETAQGLERRLAEGHSVPIEIDDDGGVALTIFAPLQLQDGSTARVEVDTGSDSLILHRRFIRPGAELKAVRGQDETGRDFERFFGRLSGPTWFGGRPELERKDVRVMFQDIIYDGLIGDDFLRNYTVTFDLAHSRMILALPRPQKAS